VSRGDQLDTRLTLERYKRLILLGKISLPLEEARRIVGPDCAYHLYFRHASDDPAADEDAPPKRTTTRRSARRRPK
jgi:hypothetical protein